jgi:membrane protein
MGDKIQKVVEFFNTGIWRITAKDVSPVKFLLVQVVKTLMIAVRFFLTKRVMQKASALTYSTLLAIVPILAVVFAVARGFGFSKYIEMWFREALTAQPQAAEIIIGFVNSYLVHTQSGVFLGIGLLFMLYTVLMLVSNVEDAFNEIWQVTKPRSLFRTFTDYLAMFFCFPIVIVVTTGISIFMATVADTFTDYLMLGPFLRFLIDLTPYVLMSGMFIALYIFMPNTHVPVKHAVVPGILAGVAMQGLQLFYIHAQIFLSGYNAIYGSFAALPLFMLWMQISWTICLFGAELSYANRHLDYYDYDTNTEELSYRYRTMLCAMLMSCICKRFADGKKPYSASKLRKETKIPIRIVNDLLMQLIKAGMVVEVTSDEKSETSHFMPAEDINNLTLGKMVERLEAQGHWKIDLDVSSQMTKEWAKAIRLRSDYLHSLRDIRLQDLRPTQIGE